MDGRTAAAVLGVRPGATKQEIRRAFRARAKQVHPDLQPPQAPAATTFVAVREAFELLLATAPEAAPTSARMADPAPAPAPDSTWAEAAPGTALDRVEPSAYSVAPAPSTGSVARWLGAPQARPTATIDLTDATGPARRPAPASGQRPPARPADLAGGAAFARCLAAELARR